jgi:putative SOS response-associated peptidase YedK
MLQADLDFPGAPKAQAIVAKKTYAAPIVRNQPCGRELTMARWGMPSPVVALKGKKSDPGVTNVRNVKSPHWRRWLGVESRCVVPFTSFSENEALPDDTHTLPSGSPSTRRGRLLSLRASGHAGPPSER